ncbi:MAG: V-type ATP synthase subunit E [Nitrospiria bacterium]
MGYQVLIETLLKEGKRKSQEIVEKGRLESEAILLEAREKARLFEQERLKEVQKDLLARKTRFLNEAYLEGRRILLEARHEILNGVFEMAVKRLETWLKDSAGDERLRIFWKRRVEEALQDPQRIPLKAFLPGDGFKELEVIFKEKGIPCEKMKDPDLWCGFKLALDEGKVEVINSYFSRMGKIRTDLIIDLQSLLFKKNG